MATNSKSWQLGNPVLSKLETILSTTGPPLVVPDYQRSYSWESEQYEEFWQDLNDFTRTTGGTDSPYFLGAAVFVDGDALEILDGQQRIATATILLSSIVRLFRRIGNDSVASEITQKNIVEESAFHGTQRFCLTMNLYDRAFFKARIQEFGPPASPTDLKTQSHRNIEECKKYFDRQFDQFLDDYGPKEAESLARSLLTTLRERVKLLSITASDFDLAADVFERLNDRGIQLSTVDLVRMLLLKLGRPDDRETLLELWGDVLELEGKANAEDLLRYYWITLEGDPTSNRLYRQIRDKFSQTCNDPTHGKPLSPLKFTQDLATAAEIYREIFDASDGDSSYLTVCANVVSLNAKPLIPFLMKIHPFSGKRDELAWLGLSAYVRNRLIGKRSSTDFESLIYRVTKEIDESNAGAKAAEIQRFMIGDETFRDEFSEAVVTVQKQARFILAAIESYLHAGELTPKSPAKVHLEHIYPRKPNKANLWDDHEDWVNRLGNLTLLATKLNQKAQNGAFSEKKEHYVCSKIELTQELLKLDDWSPKAVEDRQQRLADLAVKVWPKG